MSWLWETRDEGKEWFWFRAMHKEWIRQMKQELQLQVLVQLIGNALLDSARLDIALQIPVHLGIELEV